MGSRRTSIFENGLIWFGARSVLGRNFNRYIFRTLGFSTGLLAIIIGHIIGCGMSFLPDLSVERQEKVQWKR